MRLRGQILSAVVAVGSAHGCTAATAEPVPHGQYELIAVGGVPVAQVHASATCREIPLASWYSLAGTRWASSDTLPRCLSKLGDSSPVLAGSGEFRVDGDTVTFSVPDTTIGSRGVVAVGRAAGDSLVLWGSEVDGGDYLYLRRPRAGR